MRKHLFLLVALLMLLSLACITGTTTGQGGQQAPATAPPQQGAGPAGGMGPSNAGAPAGSAPGGSHPARSFSEAENAIIKIIATGTLASLDEGGKTVYNNTWIGSGFIIDPSGLAVTNNHVAAGAATLKVYIAGDIQKEFPARVVAASECLDLAVIQIEGGPFPVYLDWYTGPVDVGMEVYAAGFPGIGDHWQYTLTKGIISKTHEDGETSWAFVDYVYLHDARIRGGNSGGPLITADGKVVGINYAGSDVKDVNLAIPSTLAQPVVEQMRQGKPYQWIGVNGASVTASFDDGSKLSGVWVYSVETGSPADRVGLQPGDIIVEVENIALSLNGTMREYCEVLSSHTPNDPIKIRVLRWKTGEVLSGTLNSGQALQPENVAAGGGSSSSGSGGATGGQGGNGDYVVITDDLKAIAVQIPASWTQVDGSPWNTTWTKSDGSTYDVRAASLNAAPDLQAFGNFEGPGVWIIASRDFGRIGGYAQLLDGVQHWFNQDCELYDEGNYNDSLYEGRYQIWERCGPRGQVVSIVAAVRPKNNPTAYLTLVIVNATTNDDLQSIVASIMGTFQVVGVLP